MAVEIYVLSGARQGQRVVLDRAAFAAGDGPGCDIPFDPSQDPDVRGRRVEFVFDEEGWRIRNVGEQRIRSGDIVRLSEFGPDFSFALLFGQGAPKPQIQLPATPPSVPIAALTLIAEKTSPPEPLAAKPQAADELHARPDAAPTS